MKGTLSETNQRLANFGIFIGTHTCRRCLSLLSTSSKKMKKDSMKIAFARLVLLVNFAYCGSLDPEMYKNSQGLPPTRTDSLPAEKWKWMPWEKYIWLWNMKDRVEFLEMFIRTIFFWGKIKTPEPFEILYKGCDRDEWVWVFSRERESRFGTENILTAWYLECFEVFYCDFVQELRFVIFVLFYIPNFYSQSLPESRFCTQHFSWEKEIQILVLSPPV